MSPLRSNGGEYQDPHVRGVLHELKADISFATKPDSSICCQQPSKLVDQVRERIRTKHYSHRTEQTCVQRIRRFTLFHDKRHPKDMGGLEVEAFLTNLATERKFGASTQTQALCAVLFLYQEVLGIQLP